MKCLHRDTPPALKWPTEKMFIAAEIDGIVVLIGL